jgi:hypothetical protein
MTSPYQYLQSLANKFATITPEDYDDISQEEQIELNSILDKKIRSRFGHFSDAELMNLIIKGQKRDDRFLLDYIIKGQIDPFKYSNQAKKARERLENNNYTVDVIDEDDEFTVIVNGKPKAKGTSSKDALLNAIAIYWS